MKFNKSSKRQSELTDFIKCIFNADETSIEKNRDYYIELLVNIYKPVKGDDKFRHNYSQLFGTIISLESQDDSIDDDVDNNIVFTSLSNKLQFLLKSYEQREDANEDVLNSIRKLYDHVNLDIARLDYNRSNISKLQSKINDLNAKKLELQKEMNELQELSNETRKELKNSKVDYITILGIFASIVMACVGTIAFSTSVLNNMKEVSIYRLITVALIIGFVFFNMIWLLTVFINKIHDKKSKIFNIAALVFKGNI